MNRKTIPLLLLAGLAGIFIPARADLLVTYTEFENEQGEDPVLTATSVANNLSATAMELTDGGNITTGNFNSETWESDLPYLQARSGWSETDPLSAKAFTFTLSAEEDHHFALEGFRFEDRATGSGPSAATVFINDEEVFSKNVEDGSTEVNFIDLSGFDTNNLESAEFMVAGWDSGWRSTTGGGDWRVAGFEVIGSASPIPEPSTYALIGGIFVLVLAFALRRRARGSPDPSG